MATPAWLPPLNSDREHYITVQISQNREAQIMEYLVYPSIFSMDFRASVNFVSNEEGSGEKSFRGLEIADWSFLPWDSTSEVFWHSYIGDMLYERCKFEFDRNMHCAERHLTDEIASWRTAYGERDLFDKIGVFLSEMTSKEYNRGKNVLPFELVINKTVIIPDEELKSWNSWYDEKKRSDPNFENEFQRVIGRPRTDEELMEEFRVASRGTWMAPIFLDLEVVEVEESSSEKFCSICLDEFLPHSKAIKLTCGHVFDENCIGKWLQESQTCPLCRRLTIADVICKCPLCGPMLQDVISG